MPLIRHKLITWSGIYEEMQSCDPQDFHNHDKWTVFVSENNQEASQH